MADKSQPLLKLRDLSGLQETGSDRDHCTQGHLPKCTDLPSVSFVTPDNQPVEIRLKTDRFVEVDVNPRLIQLYEDDDPESTYEKSKYLPGFFQVADYSYDRLTGYGSRLAGAKELTQNFSPQPFSPEIPNPFDRYLTSELIEKYRSHFDPQYVWGLATFSPNSGGVITSYQDFVTILWQTARLTDPTPKMITHFLKEMAPQILKHEPEQDQPRKHRVLAAIAIILLAAGEDIDMNIFGPSLYHIASKEEISYFAGGDGMQRMNPNGPDLFIRSFLSQYRSRQSGPAKIEFDEPLTLTANPDDLMSSREEYIASGKWFEDIRKATTPELSSITFSNPWSHNIADPAHQKQNCRVTGREFLSHVHPDFMHWADEEHQRRFLKILFLRPQAEDLRPENNIDFISDAFESLEFVRFMMTMPNCPERNTYLGKLVHEHPDTLVHYAHNLLARQKSQSRKSSEEAQIDAANMSDFYLALPHVSLVYPGFIFDPIWQKLLKEFRDNDRVETLFHCYNQAYAFSADIPLSLDESWDQYVAWGEPQSVSATSLRRQSWAQIKAKKEWEIEALWKVEDFFIEFNELLWGQTNPQTANRNFSYDFGDMAYAIQNNDKLRFAQALAQINADFLEPLGYGLVAQFEKGHEGLIGIVIPVKIVGQEEMNAGPLKDIPVTYVRNIDNEFPGLQEWYVENGVMANLEAARNFGMSTSFVQPETYFTLNKKNLSSKSLCGVMLVMDQEEQHALKIWRIKIKSSRTTHPHPYVQAMYDLLSGLKSQNEEELALAFTQSTVAHEIGHLVEYGHGVTQKDEVYACLQQIAGSPEPRAVIYRFAKLVFAYDAQKKRALPMALLDQQGQTTGYVVQQSHGQGQMYFFLAFAHAQGELGADETWLTVYESDPQRFDQALSRTLIQLLQLTDDEIRDLALQFAAQWLGE